MPTRFPVFDLELPIHELRPVTGDLDGGSVTELGTNEVDITLRSDVLFGKDSDALKPEARARLAEVAAELGRRAPGTVTITGYTDDLGSEEHGLDLSRRRAQAVRGVLAPSLARHRVTVEGKGEADPAYPNDSEPNRARNRRVVISWAAA